MHTRVYEPPPWADAQPQRRARTRAPRPPSPASGADPRAVLQPRAPRCSPSSPRVLGSASGARPHAPGADSHTRAASFFSRGSPGDGSAGARGGGAQRTEGGRGRPRAARRYRRGRGSSREGSGRARRGCQAQWGRVRGASAGLRPGCRCRVAPMLRFPTCFPSFRVVGEKQLPQEIIFLVWSPKRDLIALANTAGEVSETAWSPRNTAPDRQRARTDCPGLSCSFCELGRPPVYPAPPSRRL